TFSAEGANQTQTVTVTDKAGNVAQFTSPAVNVDLTAPVTIATSQSAPTGQQITLSATDNLSAVATTVYTVDGGAQQAHNGTAFTVTGNGPHTVTFSSTDKAGNTEIAKTFTFTVNISAPITTATLAGPQGNNGFYTGKVTVTLLPSSKSSTLTGTFYTIDGGPRQTYSDSFTISGDALHTLTFFSTDVAGNTEAANTLPVKIDATPPVTTATVAPANSGAQAARVAGGTFTGPVTVMLLPKDNLSGVAVTTYALDGGPTQTYTPPFTVSAPGDHTVIYSSTDNAGNAEAPKTLTFTISSPAAVSVLHTFPAGLHLFSVPKDLSGVPLTQALSVAAPKLAVWQPQLAQYILTPTAPADALRPGQGYWARFPTATSLFDLGAPTPTNQPFAIPIQNGWNMIGDPFPTAVSGGNIRLLKGGKVYSLTDPVARILLAPTLYSYDEATGQYQAHALRSDALAPYVGYWLFSRCDGSLLVSPP
ncbi:MAG: hypothetical protein M3Y28_10925, partial [Armatimonadota bacterium]|nr:hypothetical protein [Armatimonadota bacterium]